MVNAQKIIGIRNRIAPDDDKISDNSTGSIVINLFLSSKVGLASGNEE